MVARSRIDERQFWVETVDGSGNRTEIIDSIIGAQVNRVLDGVGQIAIQVSGTDKRALDALTTGTKVKLYTFERNQKRLLGAGIIRKSRASDRSSSFTVSLTGPDELDDLRRKSILLSLNYDSETLDDIVNGTPSLQGLLDFVTGWTGNVTLSSSHYARFDGISVLKCIQELVEAKGTHFRLSSLSQIVDIGDFGTSNGLTLMEAPVYSPGMDSNDNIGIIESIQINEDADDLLDFIIPLGAGSASDIALTLEDSTRTSPYTIQVDTYNGRTYYYLGTSTKTLVQVFADNSLTIKTVVFDQIQVISNSAADIEAGANALYDIASAYLTRRSQALTEYDVTVRKLRSNVLPGDKIRLMYKGFIQDAQSGELLPPRDINSDFWIMGVTENVTQDGLMTSLKLATVDRVIKSEARIIVGELEKARVRTLTVKPYPTVNSFVYDRMIDFAYHAFVPIKISNDVLRIRRVLLQVKTDVLRSPIRSSAANPSHNHTVGTLAADSGATGNYRYVTMSTTLGSDHVFRLEEVTNSGQSEVTTDAGGTYPGIHAHTMDYEIKEDTQYPYNLSIHINGTDRTSALGGPFGATSSAQNFELDITPYITGASTIYQTHQVRIIAGNGQGRLEITVSVYQDIQTVEVT